MISTGILLREKYDGVRMLVTYRRSEGLDFYTRSISDVNYLPISYKENLIVDASLIDDALEDFVIDCELVANRSIGDEALLHSVTGLLSNLPEEAQRKQRENPHMLKFMVFDCLQCNGVRVLEKPLAERRDFIAQVLQHLDPRILPVSAIVSRNP